MTLNLVFLFVFIGLCESTIENIHIWPYPTKYVDSPGGYTLKYTNLQFKLFSRGKYIPIEKDEVIYKLTQRYQEFLFTNNENDKENGITYLVVFQVNNINDRNLKLGFSENYTLNANNSTCVIISETAFGSIRGLETFAQLVTNQEIKSLPLSIIDQPRYPWRGLMVDVARHYIKIETIQKLIDGMAYNKLNCLHLHLTDSQSFPLFLPDYPDLAKKGAYDPVNAIYTPQELKDLVHYAYLRGIRIVPEIEMPGHAYSWYEAYPEIVALCDQYLRDINMIPLDPSISKTYEIVKGIISSVKDIFPDEYFHIAGDEVQFECWEEIHGIVNFMKEKGIENGRNLQGYFMNEVKDNITDPLGLKVIAWQELAQNKPTQEKYEIPKDVMIEVWQNPDDMKTVIENGYSKVITSAGWYFDRQRPMYINHYLLLDVWEDMYVIEPESYVDEKNWGSIYGGEGTMFGEQVNDLVVEQRIFPKLCAVAERLWSSKEVNIDSTERRVLEENDVDIEMYSGTERNGLERRNGVLETLDIARERLMTHICHNLIRRGIKSSPIRADYCGC